ncbi:MAG TPA: M48 family peptidase [Methyloprofundus sp.]|uniref:M48 family metallopeptidase n=1 Tax=Methyloprofundus sp. TaxID=2020875 RepID=UPI001846ECE3|nr:SprT family zinc-dependent metalloprotease [Methyloprofundus sp.]HIG64304.1 M48 family peptidase [Methyloprofundus sp.]HIL78805.1 M48 family peptidase [Methylococcales bacterium]
MNSKQVYQIRRSQRAKRARIVVTAEKVEVVAPLRMPERQIHQFMRAKLDWIESAKNKVQRHVDTIASLAPALYQQGAMIPYLGKQYKLEIKLSQNRQIEIAFAGAFIANVPDSCYQSLTSAALSEEIRAALIIWMREAAGKLAAQTMGHYVPLYQLNPRSITIKTQKSRWGSCGIHNDINLNWLLILAPVEVFEYVVIHELCHIAQRNHSAAFWALVARYCHDYQQQRGWLKRHGSSLMLGL